MTTSALDASDEVTQGLLLKFLSYCSSLLVDGFEAGNTSAWSSTVP